MPRPRRFSEQARPAQVAQAYAEGRSTRELEAELGLSRWVISRWCTEHGTPMRSRDDALERQRWFRSIADEAAEALKCVWPGCHFSADDRRMCTGHWLEAVEWDGRDCAVPRCPQDALRGERARLCDFHARRADGTLT